MIKLENYVQDYMRDYEEHENIDLWDQRNRYDLSK